MNKFKFSLLMVLSVEMIVWYWVYTNPVLGTTQNIQYIFGGNIVALLVIFYISTRHKNVMELKLKNIIGDEYVDAIEFSETIIIVLDDDFAVKWVSDPELSKKILGEKVDSWLPNFELLQNKPWETIESNIKKELYSIKYSKENNSLVITNKEDLRLVSEAAKNNELVFGFIKIDHYDDIISSKDQKVIFDLSVIVGNTIQEWSEKLNMQINKVSEELYNVILTNSSFQKAKNLKFDFVHKIKEKTDKDLQLVVTFSIGFGLDSGNIKKLNDLALEALEKSERRGGDQISIAALGQEIEYMGGNQDARAVKSRTKINNFAKKLNQELKKRGSVIVAGHEYADYDSVSSAIAIGALSRSYGRTTKVVLDFKKLDHTTKSHLELYLGKDYIKKYIITPREAKKLVRKNTLVIIVDTSSPSRVEAPELVKVSNRKIVIDHHRAGKDVIENMLIEHIDPGVSSAAEIIIETIGFIQKEKVLTKKEINLLFAGILVDTNNFKSGKAGARTFQVAATLKSWGAEQSIALELLKEPKEVIELRYEILKNAKEFRPGFMISKISMNREITNSIVAQGAQTLMEVRGIRAAFVIGNDSAGNCLVSARSNDSVNVQLMMESIGGGGHFNAAATKVKLTSIEHMGKIVKEIINKSI